MAHPPHFPREIVVNNLIKRFSCLLLAFTFFISGVVNSAQAATVTNLCRDTGVAFAFLNGVQTTYPQAEIAKQEFKRIHGVRSAQGDEIKYEVLYNYCLIKIIFMHYIGDTVPRQVVEQQPAQYRLFSLERVRRCAQVGQLRVGTGIFC